MQTITTERKLKEEFSFTLSRLSHEIRNPISLISSELQLMASSHPELCSYRQWNNLMDNLEYVKELLNELSDFSHAGTVHLTPTNPKEFLNTVLSCEKTMLDYLGITLETHIEDISGNVLLDRIKMRQVIFNLIRNSCEAIDHTRGKITVALCQTDSGICIPVQDNGCGMTAETLKSVTDPFYTTRTTRKVGLGIPMFKENAELTGGTFSIHFSNSPVMIIAEPSRVNTPNQTASAGMKISVTAVTSAPHPNTTAPRLTGWRPSGRQKPDSRMNTQQMDCCHSSPCQLPYHGARTPNR